MVDHSYLGCRTQEYLGEKVEWCFCEGSKYNRNQPCNGASRDALSKMALPEYPDGSTENSIPQTKYFLPTESKDIIQDTKYSDENYDSHYRG